MSQIKSAQIQFTNDEANILIDIIHKAVKSEGLAIAKDAVYFQDKIAGAFVVLKMEMVQKPVEAKNEASENVEDKSKKSKKA